LRALHGHNSRRPEGYLGLQGRRVEHRFESNQGTDGQAMGTGTSCRNVSFDKTFGLYYKLDCIKFAHIYSSSI
jgi:hypothetical protein